MINLKSNANSIVKKEIHENGVYAHYLDLCTKFTNNYVQTFIPILQGLITKVGIIVSSVDIHNPRISFCSQSINYLCKTVLDNPQLITTFKDLGINEKANKGKHDITTQNIDMARCVTTFNNLINLIANKYNLFSLTDLIIKKKSNNPSVVEQKKVTKTNVKVSKPDETASTNDERLRLTAVLKKGDGRYKKGLFKKVNMVNFQLQVSITNPDNLKISSVTAIFKCGNNSIEKKIPTDGESLTDIDLETVRFSGNISATIIAVYKIGLFKSKQIKTTISKDF